jgi:hypothetical protein
MIMEVVKSTEAPLVAGQKRVEVSKKKKKQRSMICLTQAILS